uniref:ARAD1C29942p n=1 Tax=Blastobotrys adeninivorans TaxID=409370 RepID=A0A060T7S6_BLAAD
MWIFVVIAFLVTALVALLGIRQFTRLRKTPPFILVPLFIAVYIPCSIVVLVPIDLMSSSDSKHPLFYVGEKARLIMWRVIYWLAFALTWAILPVLQSYVESGYHEPWRKTMDALRRNLKYQLLMLGAGVVGLLYVIITSGLSLGSVKALVIALSHSYALVMAIWLLGHGLVNVPRNMWQEANPQTVLKHRYLRATRVQDAFSDSQSTYADVVAEVNALRPHKNEFGQYVEWIDELLDEVDSGPGVAGFSGYRSSGNRPTTVDRSLINEEYLSTLTARLSRAKARAIRCHADWQKLLKDCAVAEDILNARQQGSKSLVFRYSRTRLSPRMAATYYCRGIHTIVVRVIAAILTVLSVIIVWSEVTHGTIVSVVNIIVSSAHGIVQQMYSTMLLGFMCVCVFASLTRIRVFNVYALVHRSSDTSSLLFYAMYACRLTVPLSYNYLTLISSRESAFQDFLGKSINLTALGKYFNDWLPRLVIVPVLLTLFYFYDKIKDFLGFGLSFEDEEEDDDRSGTVTSSAYIEGRETVSRALSDPNSRYAIDPLRRPDYRASGYLDSPNLGNLGSQQSFDQQPTSRQPTFNIRATPNAGSRTLGSGLLDEGQDSGPLEEVRSFFGTLGSKIRDFGDEQWTRLRNN